MYLSRNYKYLFTLFLLFIVAGSKAYAQQDKQKAIEKYQAGFAFYSQQKYYDALEQFQGSFEASPHSLTAYMLSCSAVKTRKSSKAKEYAEYVVKNPSGIQAALVTTAKDIIKWAQYVEYVSFSAGMRTSGPSTYSTKSVKRPDAMPVPNQPPWAQAKRPQVRPRRPAINQKPAVQTIDTNQWYRLTNSFLKEKRSLDTYSGKKNDPFMGQTGGYSGQYWKLTPLGKGYYRLTNSFLGDSRSLDTYSGKTNAPFMGKTGGYSGQYWKLTPLGNGYYRLTNAFLGEGRSLDTYGGKENKPFMGKTGNYSGQYWKLKPMGKIR